MASTDPTALPVPRRATPPAPVRLYGTDRDFARNRALSELRERIAQIEGEPVCRLENTAADPRRQGDAAAVRRASPKLMSLGDAAADAALGGGFPAAGLAEIHLDETRDGGSLAGFALALAIRFGARPGRPLLWIGDMMAFSEAGLPYLPGLASFGLDPAALCLVKTRKLDEAAWAGEEAATSRALAMAILEVRGNPARLGLDGTRRLHLRARDAGLPLLLLRQSARPEATAAPLRLRIRPGPASRVADLADRDKLIGHPVFDVTVEKSRDGRPQHVVLEWNSHERRFGPPARSEPLSRPLVSTAVDGQDPARADGTVVALRRAS